MTYTRDGYALDAHGGKRRFIVSYDEETGEMDISPMKGNAPDPALAYENCGENSETYRSGKSAKKDQPANDAARISKLSAEARKATADAMLRNRSYAAVLKAKSAALQPRADLHKVRPI